LEKEGMLAMMRNQTRKDIELTRDRVESADSPG